MSPVAWEPLANQVAKAIVIVLIVMAFTIDDGDATNDLTLFIIKVLDAGGFLLGADMGFDIPLGAAFGDIGVGVSGVGGIVGWALPTNTIVRIYPLPLRVIYLLFMIAIVHTRRSRVGSAHPTRLYRQ